MDDEIFRQRHYLIAISTMLILFDFCDKKIAKVGVSGHRAYSWKPRCIGKRGPDFFGSK